jgi:uncharacterized protein (TIGR02453 family)
MAFTGWPDEAIEFYEGLAADNSKTYWTRHKPVYEQMVLAPMAELVDELAAEFPGTGETKIFRPYRDVRFSKDKTLYKTHIAALAGGGYLQFSAGGLAAGLGMYAMSPAELQKYRQAVADDDSGAELERVIAEVTRTGISVHGHEVLKTVPRGYPADHPRADLLRWKGVVAWRDWPAGPWLGTGEAKHRVTGFLRAARPLGDWLGRHVREPAGEPAGR